MGKMSKTTMGRWDKDVLKEVKEVLPKESQATISRLLWEQSEWKKEFLKKRSKGSIQDVALLVVALFVIAMVTLIGFKVSNTWNDTVQGSSLFNADGKAAVSELNDNFTGTIDNMFMFIVVFFCLASLILAALVRIHPIFLPFYLFVLVIVIFVGGVASNVYEEVASTDGFSAEANALTLTSFVMTKLPFIAGVFGALLAIVAYKSWSVSRLGL